MSCFCVGGSVSPYKYEDANVVDTVKEHFPGAVKSADLAAHVKMVLNKNGFMDQKTLIATSLCCDEVNREMENDLISLYNSNFSMGGLAGFPFGGVTSFGAMSHHIPDNGSCLVVYGPHVGVDKDGAVGRVNRRGRYSSSGVCCGSAAAAAAYCKVIQAGGKKNDDIDVLDAQQTFVGNLLLPFADRLSTSETPDVELPLALFDAQDELMKNIIAKGCGEVAGEGKIAILGGIQINTPAGTSEYFMPKVFEIRDNKNNKIVDLLASF